MRELSFVDHASSRAGGEVQRGLAMCPCGLSPVSIHMLVVVLSLVEFRDGRRPEASAMNAVFEWQWTWVHPVLGEFGLRPRIALCLASVPTRLHLLRQYPRHHEMKTFLTVLSSHFQTSPSLSVGSRTQPSSTPTFSNSPFSLSRPKTRPVGNTTGSSSM